MAVVKRHVGGIAQLDQQSRARLVRDVLARTVRQQVVEEHHVAGFGRNWRRACNREAILGQVVVTADRIERAEFVPAGIDAQTAFFDWSSSKWKIAAIIEWSRCGK